MTQQADIKEEELRQTVSKILPIMLERGLKGTTMDTVAASLGMSKRTLYEIFGSKSEMIREVFAEHGRRNRMFVDESFRNSENVMEALIKIFRYTRDNLQSLKPDFFHEMDRLYTHQRANYNSSREERHNEMKQVFERGVEQGVFRTDFDFDIQSRIMGIQMESLKRMEELFPPDITLLQVYDSIIIGFLRSIASEKGLKLLDKTINKTID